MDRRKFLVSSGIVGAGLLGAGKAAPGLLQAETRSDFNLNLNVEDKPVAFTVPPLPYSFDALEPYIDAKTMEIHHDKHHGAYVTNLNKALEGHADLQAKSIDDLLKGLDSVPENIRIAVRNNGGGHWNHSLFWQLMKKGGGGEPKGDRRQPSARASVLSPGLRISLRPRAWAIRLRVGLAAGEGSQAGHRLHAEPGHAVLCRR